MHFAPLLCPCHGGPLLPLPTASPSVSSTRPPELPAVARLSPLVWRILGRNPSAFTLTGTNIYLVGSGSSRVLIDAGEGFPGVLQDVARIMTEQGCTRLSEIVITHWHRDHILGVPELLGRFGPVRVRKFMPAEGTGTGEHGPDFPGPPFDPIEFLQGISSSVVELTDGEIIACEGATLRVMHTPGHANDHVCLMLEEERALFTGDNVLGWGTGTFQDLTHYMASLRRMADEAPEILYPAHGPVVGPGAAGPWMQMYIKHREERIEQVQQALKKASKGLSLESVVREVYKDQPHIFPNELLFRGACGNTKLVLRFLVKQGHCVEHQGLFQWQPTSHL